MSRVTYWVVEDRPVTWLILIFCPSLGLGVGSNFSSNFDDTRVMLDPESIMICAEGPSGKLSLTVALEGCAPKKVVPGGRPATGLSCLTSELKVSLSVEPKPPVPRTVDESQVVSVIGN
jgi:hypothetical protein